MHIILRRVLFFFCALILAASVGFAQTGPDPDPLAEWGITATTGAASGYVPDAACATCHSDKAESFTEMGMAKSFYRPSLDNVIETFSNEPFFHGPSERYYQMALRDGAYWFTRYRLAADGSRVNVFERKVDWILGSGHHSRIYLYQTENGTLLQLPLAWYTQDAKWEMAPGYEFAEHPGVTRVVPKRCMSCHNAFPQVPEGSDLPGHPVVFPADLPEGIGCQRCHGPGAEHARLAIAGDAPLTKIHAAIVQPAKLSYEKRYGICYGCHMQPTVAINMPLRLGRGDYSFRPGEDIKDFLTHIDIVDANRAKEDRFDINHHPYRLEQSTCFLETADWGENRLGCLTCHDPHVKIKPAQRAAHYRKACLSCHTLDEAGLPVSAQGKAVHPEITPTDDCTTCHMPTRRTQDVIHVTMTDHRITRDPGPLDKLIARFGKTPPNATEVMLLYPDTLSQDEALLQNLRAVLSHSGPSPDWAIAQLRQQLEKLQITDGNIWADLAKFLYSKQRYPEALETAEKAMALAPENPQARSIYALSLLRNDQPDQALAVIIALNKDIPNDAGVLFNRAIILAISNRTEDALDAAEKAVWAQSSHWPAHRLIGQLRQRSDDPAAAITSYLKALAIEPDAPRVRSALHELLMDQGQEEEAQRHAR